MITQIELDDFKTFKDFKVELAPFQVIVGPNGSGKSNLFDALRLLRCPCCSSRTSFSAIFTAQSRGITPTKLGVSISFFDY
jgi:AAA15 family ATPase/GTPase